MADQNLHLLKEKAELFKNDRYKHGLLQLDTIIKDIEEHTINSLSPWKSYSEYEDYIFREGYTIIAFLELNEYLCTVA